MTFIRHRTKIWISALVLGVILAGTLGYGLDYYKKEAGERVLSDKHRQLRPSGTIGVRLGMLGVVMFIGLYAYPVRKRWKWLQRFGKTKNWLDFHILLGVTAPLVITLHSSFKFQGVAGVAYWLMIAVMASGFIGRYIYAQIPKSLNETALSFREIEQLSIAARSEIARQRVIPGHVLERALKAPDAFQVESMSVIHALARMVWSDILRPFQTAALRRGAASSAADMVRTVFGFLPTRTPEIEDAIRLVRRQSRLATKMAFLGRANQIFQLWHVVHRPFSYSFAVLACLHIAVVLMMGYF